jgi:hypothetical protein
MSGGAAGIAGPGEGVGARQLSWVVWSREPWWVPPSQRRTIGTLAGSDGSGRTANGDARADR